MNDTHDRCFFTVQHLIQIRTGMNLFLRSVIALNQIPQIFRLSQQALSYIKIKILFQSITTL